MTSTLWSMISYIDILGERSRPRAARDTVDYDESRRVTFTDEASDERQRSAAGAGSGLR